jgi:hypothetical protein
MAHVVGAERLAAPRLYQHQLARGVRHHRDIYGKIADLLGASASQVAGRAPMVGFLAVLAGGTPDVARFLQF